MSEIKDNTLEDNIKYQEFVNYNWNECPQWKQYYMNIYPPQTSQESIIQLRKRFYKRNVDPTFNIDFKPHAKEDSKASNKVPTKEQQKQPEKNSDGILFILIKSIESLLWTLVVLKYLSFSHSSNIAALACIFTLFSESKSPFSEEFRDQLKRNDNFQMLIYAIFVLSLDTLNHFLMFPFLPLAAINLAKYCKNNLKIFKFLKPYAYKILQSEDLLHTFRGYSLISIGFFLFFGILIGMNQGFIIITHWIFLIYMNRNNYEVQRGFSKIGGAIAKVQKGKHTPKILSRIYEVLLSFSRKFN